MPSSTTPRQSLKPSTSSKSFHFCSFLPWVEAKSRLAAVSQPFATKRSPSLLQSWHEKESGVLDKNLPSKQPHDGHFDTLSSPSLDLSLATRDEAAVIVHGRRCLDVKPAEKGPSHFSFPISRGCLSSHFLPLPLSPAPALLHQWLTEGPGLF